MIGILGLVIGMALMSLAIVGGVWLDHRELRRDPLAYRDALMRAHHRIVAGPRDASGARRHQPH